MNKSDPNGHNTGDGTGGDNDKGDRDKPDSKGDEPASVSQNEKTDAGVQVVSAAGAAIGGKIGQAFGEAVGSRFGQPGRSAGGVFGKGVGAAIGNAMTGSDDPEKAKPASPKTDDGKKVSEDPPQSKETDKLAKAIANAEKNLERDGPKSLQKARDSLERQIEKHNQKIDEAKRTGGFTSAMERENRGFQTQVDAINHVLGD